MVEGMREDTDESVAGDARVSVESFLCTRVSRGRGSAELTDAWRRSGGDQSSLLDCAECPVEDIRTYSPLALAFIGDAVFGLCIRTAIVKRGNTAPGRLHEACSRLVNAPVQSRMARGIFDELSDEEKGVYRRGRNAQAPSRAKHATMSEYRHATGLEALFGYLYLTGQERRLSALAGRCLEIGEGQESRAVRKAGEARECRECGEHRECGEGGLSEEGEDEP